MCSVCEACKLNNILGQIFLKDNWTENFSQYAKLDVDTRFPAETQLAGFKKNGFEMPPRAAEVLQLMVKAQRRRLNLRRKIDSLDDNGRPSGRYVHYPKTFDEAMSQFQDRRDTAHTDRCTPGVDDVDDVDLEEADDNHSDEDDACSDCSVESAGSGA